MRFNFSASYLTILTITNYIELYIHYVSTLMHYLEIKNEHHIINVLKLSENYNIKILLCIIYYFSVS